MKYSSCLYSTVFSAMLLATHGHASEMGHVCANELACIEELYEQKKYDPVDFAALKLTVGGEDSLSYNDNIFRSATNEKSDILNHFAPYLALQSNLDRHAWGAQVKLDNAIYFSHSENNHTDFSALADGRYDINPELALSARGGYVLDHVTIGSFVDEPGALNTEPTAFHTVTGYAALDYHPVATPWHVNVGAGVDVINYENVRETSGVLDIQDDRDRNEYIGALHLGYRLRPNTEVYAKTVHEDWDHDKRIDTSTVSTRDSDQHRYMVGYRDNESGLAGLSYDVAIGYLEQNYQAGRLDDVNALDFYADARWKVDPANTLRLMVSRDVYDAYSDQRSAYLRTDARLNYEHDYSERIRYGAGFRYSNNDFESLPSATLDREDDVYGLNIWGGYEFYQNLEAKLFYTYTDRDSNEAAASYNANVIGIALSYKD